MPNIVFLFKREKQLKFWHLAVICQDKKVPGDLSAKWGDLFSSFKVWSEPWLKATPVTHWISFWNILLAKHLLGCYCPTRILLTGNVYWIILNTQNMLVIKNKQTNKKPFHWYTTSVVTNWTCLSSEITICCWYINRFNKWTALRIIPSLQYWGIREIKWPEICFHKLL